MQLSLFPKQGCVGLDIGHNSIKAVQVERSGEGWVVQKAAEAPTPPDSVKDGVVIDQAAMTDAIRAILREGRFGVQVANIAVSGGPVLVRTVRVPKMPEATLRKSIRYEASRYVPTSPEESYIEFEIVGDAGENQMDIIVAAAPRDVVDSRIHACQSAGVEVDVVEVEAFAAYRSLVETNQLHDWKESVVALVDIGSVTTNVSVVERGVFSMTRSIAQGSQALTDALASYFKLSPSDAEAGKKQLDLAGLLTENGPKENPPLRVIQPLVDELIREVRRSLNYYQSQQNERSTGNAISAVLLTGGGAMLASLDRYFAHKLSLPVESVGLHSNPAFSCESIRDRSESFAVACGLAMRGLARAA